MKISISYLINGLKNDIKVLETCDKQSLAEKGIRLIQIDYVNDLIKRLRDCAEDLVKE